MSFLTKADIPFVVEADIMNRMWSKFMLNVGINQTCMAYETGYGGATRPGEAFETMKGAMREAREVARLEGIDIAEEEITSYIELMRSLTPDSMPSMRQDALAKRKTEVELFAGTVLRLAEKHGIDTPVNRRLYDRIKELEAAY